MNQATPNAQWQVHACWIHFAYFVEVAATQCQPRAPKQWQALHAGKQANRLHALMPHARCTHPHRTHPQRMHSQVVRPAQQQLQKRIRHVRHALAHGGVQQVQAHARQHLHILLLENLSVLRMQPEC